MRKIFLTLVLFLIFGCESKQEINIPEKIMQTLVIVNDSSGIVVYSDLDKALILTVWHAIGEERPRVGIVNLADETKDLSFRKFVSVGAYVDERSDLALIEIETEELLDFAIVARRDPQLGDDIYLASNPHHTFRSLKKGIISSKYRWYGGIKSWEFSGDIVGGSSGGGIFTMSGEMFGIIRAVEIYESDFCIEKYNNDWEVDDVECLKFPLYFMGFMDEPDILRNFLLDNKYGNYFEYLKQ